MRARSTIVACQTWGPTVGRLDGTEQVTRKCMRTTAARVVFETGARPLALYPEGQLAFGSNTRCGRIPVAGVAAGAIKIQINRTIVMGGAIHTGEDVAA